MGATANTPKTTMLLTVSKELEKGIIITLYGCVERYFFVVLQGATSSAHRLKSHKPILWVILSVVELLDEGGTNSSKSKSRKARRDLQKDFAILRNIT